MTDPLLHPETLREYLRSHGLPPLDRFGQHFLVDEDILERIVQAIDPTLERPLIEIGAGLGVLTNALARSQQTVAPLVAVELDRRLIPLLKERVQQFSHVHVIEADILKQSPQSLLPTAYALRPYDVVGNIPYNITAKLLRHVLSWNPAPRRITFLVDAAVAERVTAEPPDMSLLAISVQVNTEPSIVGPRIPPSAFLPPPAVHSAILQLKLRPSPLVSPDAQKDFFRLVRAGFSQKRKMLSNTLAPLWRLKPTAAADMLRAADIDPTRRAQTLTIDEWQRLQTIATKREL